MKSQQKRLAVIVADEYEDIELIATLDVLARNGIAYDLFALNDAAMVRGKYCALVAAQPTSGLVINNYDGVFMPGGPGHKALLQSPWVRKVVVDFHRSGKIVAAICAAPTVLQAAGLLDGVKMTAYPGAVISPYNTGEPFVVDGQFVTGRDYLSTIAFAEALVKRVNEAK